MKIFKHICTFLLGITLFLFILLILSQNVLLSEKSIKKHLENINYYEEVYSNILELFEDNTRTSGLNIEEIKSTVDKDTVKKDIDNAIDILLKNENNEINTDTLQYKIDEKIYNSLKEVGRTPSEDEKKDILRLEQSLIDIYEEEIHIEKSILPKLGSTIIKIKKIMNLLNIIFIILTILLILINLKFSKDFLGTTGISFTMAGILLLSTKLILGSEYQNLLIISQTFSNLCITLVNKYILAITIVGLVSLLLGITLIIINHLKGAKTQQIPEFKK